MNVTAVEFRGPLELAMHLVRNSDLMIGMHGAVRTQAEHWTYDVIRQLKTDLPVRNREA